MSVRDVDPMAQSEVEREIMRLSNVLTTITEDVADSARRQAQGEVNYKLAYAKAMLRADQAPGTVAIKEALALDECGDQYQVWRLAEARFKACQESGRNVRAQLDALRSINANVRSAVTHAYGSGG